MRSMIHQVIQIHHFKLEDILNLLFLYVFFRVFPCLVNTKT